MSEILQGVFTTILFLVILGGLVLIHEIGHFVTARLANVRVLEFGVGFPPRAKVLRVGRRSEEDVKWAAHEREMALAAARGDPELTDEILDSEPHVPSGTVYTLNWLPIGGFVKLEDEDGAVETSDPRSFVRAGLPKKVVILLAGVFMNLVLALAIFTGIAWLATPLVGVRVPSVDPASPAEAAGIESGDSIVSVDGVTYGLFDSYTGRTDVLDDLRAHAGDTVVIGLHRADGTFDEVTATLRSPEEVAAGNGALGIRSTDETPFEPDFYGRYTSHDLGTALTIGVGETGRWFGLILAGLGDLVGGFVSDPTAPPPVAGPVGIATQIGDIFFQAGPIMTLYVAAILSANLALVNALPFPPLDGGRLFVLLVKAAYGGLGRTLGRAGLRVPSPSSATGVRVERLTYLVGFVFLFAFLIWVTGFDLARMFGGGA